MKKGLLIVIEGTDCSGKETQSNLLVKRLKKNNIKIEKFSFPMYDTPTGYIIGGPYLGKQHISNGVFKEGASNVDPKVASLYFAADRKYNIDLINNELNKGNNVLLDRYVESNMGHQASKLKTKSERLKMFKWLEDLEYNMLELPKPDVRIFLYLPNKYSKILRENRKEDLDQHENNEKHLINAENAYLELCDLYNFKKIYCFEKDNIKSIQTINDELYKKIIESIV